MAELEEEDIEALQVLAQSDLRCSRYAKVLLENRGHTIQSIKE